jgi:OOP family OmpA-OmpF porin
MILRSFGLAVVCAFAPPEQPYAASEGEASIEGDAIDDGPDKPDEKKWLVRWAPERMMSEVGIHGGILLPAPNHEWFEADPSLPVQGFKPLGVVSPDVGLRVGFYPVRYIGIEAEGGVMPSRLRDGDGSALLYTIRGQLVAQLGLWSITPFVLIGAGVIGVASPREVLGKDYDPALHFGGGVKFFIHRRVVLRLDLRDVVSYRTGVSNVSVPLGLEKEEPEPEILERAK